MAADERLSRRDLLRTGLVGTMCVPLLGLWPQAGRTADAPLLNANDPAAKTLKYTEDGSQAKGVPPDNRCANCALYQGTYGSKQGPCQIFPGKQVKATGWCSSWEPQM